MRVDFNTSSIESYKTFLRLKRIPAYQWDGSQAIVPDQYASALTSEKEHPRFSNWEPSDFLFDYQKAITKLAIQKRKFAGFIECGLGKTLILLEFAQAAQQNIGRGKNTLIVSPLMVIPQTLSEAKRFYPSLEIDQIAAADLQAWLKGNGGRIGITNYEAIREDLERGNLGGLILDESSLLKSHYGAWGTRLIDMGRGLEWKLAMTGTPAPNDRIEYANHAVFCDHFRTVNEFLARYFVNRGQTQNRWELKPHALKPFYRDLAHWCIFVSNPAVYGWKDNSETIPPINIHIDDIDLTTEQRKEVQSITGGLFVNQIGGIGQRGKLSQLAKGRSNGEDISTEKPEFIRKLVNSWPDESTIVWCRYNAEQESMQAVFPDAANISGDTPLEERLILLEWFKGEICTCERQKRIASICRSTTKTTSSDGISEALKSKQNTTPSVEQNMPSAMKQKREPGKKSKNGNPPILASDSIKECEHMDSLSTNTKQCSHDKKEPAQFADASRQVDQHQSLDCMLIIATKQASSEDCSAGTATTESENLKTISSCSKRLLCTCEQGKPCGRIMISKPRVLGYGLNLQIATRQVFSGLQDSYEEFWQAVKRSNRVGSTRPLNVHIPVTEIEAPMIQTVLEKAKRVQQDTEEQESLFRASGIIGE